MQISEKSPNEQFSLISNNFLDKYIHSSLLGISYCSMYYIHNCKITLNITYQAGPHPQTHELIGLSELVNKFFCLKISSIKYNKIQCNYQPVEQDLILITFYSVCEINNKNHNIINSILLKMVDQTPLIVNQIINLFE